MKDVLRFYFYQLKNYRTLQVPAQKKNETLTILKSYIHWI